jgi:uncharacterized protein YndB with AHSA1/START domain
MNDDPSAVLRIERTFHASAERVFDAWISPEVLRRWWHAEHDWETPHAEVDPRVGGVIRAVMRNPRDGAEYGGQGVFTVLDRPFRLAYRWTWDSSDGEQVVEVEFHEDGGATTVVLTSRGLSELELEDHRDGWDASFDNLEAALAR